MNEINLLPTSSSLEMLKGPLNPKKVATSSPSFSSYFNNLVNETVQSLKGAEKVSMDSARHETDVVGAALALNNALMTLKTSANVINRATGAIKEIINMAI